MNGNQCPCGRPIPGNANLCTTCGDNLRDQLHKIADRWPSLEHALTATSSTIGTTGKQTHGMIAVGTNLNEAAVRARRACTDAVWFAMQVIREDLNTADRNFTPPATSTTRSQDATPALARWLATWQVQHITHRTTPETAREIRDDIRRAEERTYQVCETTRHRRIPTGLPCERDTTDLGARCDGTMSATLGEQMPDLVCSVDVTHRIPPDVWSRQYWRRLHTVEVCTTPPHPRSPTSSDGPRHT